MQPSFNSIIALKLEARTMPPRTDRSVASFNQVILLKTNMKLLSGSWNKSSHPIATLCSPQEFIASQSCWEISCTSAHDPSPDTSEKYFCGKSWLMQIYVWLALEGRVDCGMHILALGTPRTIHLVSSNPRSIFEMPGKVVRFAPSTCSALALEPRSIPLL